MVSTIKIVPHYNSISTVSRFAAINIQRAAKTRVNAYIISKSASCWSVHTLLDQYCRFSLIANCYCFSIFCAISVTFPQREEMRLSLSV